MGSVLVMSMANASWTGWLEGDLGVATVDVAVRLDIVEFRIGLRCLAVVHRELLRAWVRDPVAPMAVDDVEFVLHEAQLAVLVDGAGPYPLPAGVVSQLVRSL